jgi:hypothetical protein
VNCRQNHCLSAIVLCLAVLAAAPTRTAPDSAALGLSLELPALRLGFRAKRFDLRLAAGRPLAEPAPFGFVRAGDPAPGSDIARFDPFGPHGRVSLPLLPRLAVTAEGGFLGDAAAFATLGLTHRLAGDGGPGSWYLSGGLGFAFQRTGPECRGARLCFNSGWSATPMVIVGLEFRF